MEYYGVSCFVAHEDIEPTEAWQDEIQKALFSMDALLALITKDFSNSNGTDQEIGVALGRGVPIIPVRLGADPYGFIGKYQALNGNEKTDETIAKEIYDVLWKQPSLKPRITEGLIKRFEAATTYGHAIMLMKYIERISNVSPTLIERLRKAPEIIRIPEPYTARRNILRQRIIDAGKQPEGLIYRNTNGGPVEYQRLDRAIRIVLRSCGIQKKSPIHSFRHTAAMRLISAKMPPNEVACQLGDTVETIVRVYVRPAIPSQDLVNTVYGAGSQKGHTNMQEKEALAASGGSRGQAPDQQKPHITKGILDNFQESRVPT